MPRMTVDLSSEIDSALSSIAAENQMTKADTMRKAFALLALFNDEKKKGKCLGIISEDENHNYRVDAKIIGF
jgi:hypothetical protein